MKHRFTFETTFWVLIIAAAVLFRIVLLQVPALTESEAAVALQAVHLAEGERILVSQTPLAVLLSGMLFYLFDATPFLARLLSMLSGAGLVYGVFLVRHKIGKSVALLLALLIAIDPGFVAASRQVDSPMLGMLLLFLFLVLLDKRKSILAGVALGLGLLSGLSFWQGTIFLLVSITVWNLLLGKEGDAPWSWLKANARVFWQERGWLGFLSAILITGTFFLIVPGGAGEAFSGLIVYFTGWAGNFKNSLSQFLLLLPSYELMPLVIGLIYGIIATLQRNRRDQFLMLFFLFSLILTLAYPGRNVLDMVWVVLPLLVLSAEAIDKIFSIASQSWLPSAGLGLIVAILVSFALYSSMLVFTQGIGGANFEARLIGLIGAIVVAAILVVMMAWAWSGSVGIAGLGMGLLSIGLIYTVAQGFRATGLGAFPAFELWRNSARIIQPELLVSTLETISSWNNGEKRNTPIAVIGIDSPALQWELRNFPNVRYYSAYPVGEEPEIVITALGSSPAASSSYSGQDFGWASDANWNALIPQEWLNWYLKRNIPEISDTIIVWARTDILPAGKVGSEGKP